MRGADVHEVRGLGHREGLGQALVREDVLEDVLHEVQGNVVEHDRGDHLVEPSGDLHDAREKRPDAADNDAGEKAQEQSREAVEAEAQNDRGGRTGAHDELALAAEVEDAALVREDGRQRREDERARALKRLAQLACIAQSAGDHGTVALDGVLAHARDDDRAHDERQEHGDDRRNDHQGLLALLLGIHARAPLALGLLIADVGLLVLDVCHCSSPPTFLPWRERSP